MMASAAVFGCTYAANLNTGNSEIQPQWPPLDITTELIFQFDTMNNYGFKGTFWICKQSPDSEDCNDVEADFWDFISTENLIRAIKLFDRSDLEQLEDSTARIRMPYQAYAAH